MARHCELQAERCRLSWQSRRRRFVCASIPAYRFANGENGLKHRVADGLESGYFLSVAIPNQTVGNSVLLSPAPNPLE